MDYPFVCYDCGINQLWTARQQQWWYEVVGGEIETIAKRCRACRIKDRERKALVREMHMEGLEKK